MCFGEQLAQRRLFAGAFDALPNVGARCESLPHREGRLHLAQAAYDFLPSRAQLDLEGWADVDIFAH